MSPLHIVIGVSTFLGFASLLAYLYYELQVRRAERSVSSVIQGQALFNAKQIVQILSQFTDDASRLEALKTLTNYGTAQASALLHKVKAKVDIQSLVAASTNHQRAGFTGLFFLALALVVVIFYKWPLGSEAVRPQPASSPAASVAFTPTLIGANTQHAGALAAKNKIDDTEYLAQPYTTEGDGRQTKTLTCPKGKVIVPSTPKCMNTGGNPTISSEQIGQNTYRCQWPYQAVGIGIWVEMACRSPD